MTGPSGPLPPAQAPSAQLPLALRTPPDQRFDGFVAAPSSDAVPALLQSLADGSSFSSIYLVGAAGTGKTHLAFATCAAADAAGRDSAYLPLAATRGRVREALSALHAHPLVALDGLDAIVGDRDDEIALFDFHNRMHDAGHAVLYTARRAPDDLPIALGDLRSRLSQCTRALLSPLDDDGRRQVLRLRATRRGLVIEDSAIDWMMTRIDRDLGTLTTLLDRLDRASLAAQRRVTLPFLRSVLAADDGLRG